jgi:rSAM/selenodomain-associated transferase 1
MRTQLLVIAKAPVPGRVKTRLCPPCTHRQAADVAAAALADTLAAASRTPAARHTIVLSGQCGSGPHEPGHHHPPAGWRVVAQRGDGLADRLANGFADTARPGTAALLIGMDTPQVSPALLASVAAGLDRADAVLGPAEDGGWWALALRDPAHAEALRTVPMSTSDTGARTAAALRVRGLRVAYADPLRDVDTATDAWHVAGLCPDGAFAAAVRRHVPVGVAR